MELSLGNYAISNNALFRDKDYALVGIQSIKSLSDLYKHQHCCYLPFSLSLVFNEIAQCLWLALQPISGHFHCVLICFCNLAFGL